MRSNGGGKFKDPNGNGKFKLGGGVSYDQKFGDIFGKRTNRNVKSITLKNSPSLRKSWNKDKTIQFGENSPVRKSTKTSVTISQPTSDLAIVASIADTAISPA